MRCPQCREKFSSSEAMPFCSKRCRSEDLGKWMDGSYRIIGDPINPETIDPSLVDPGSQLNGLGALNGSGSPTSRGDA